MERPLLFLFAEKPVRDKGSNTFCVEAMAAQQPAPLQVEGRQVGAGDGCVCQALLALGRLITVIES